MSTGPERWGGAEGLRPRSVASREVEEVVVARDQKFPAHWASRCQRNSLLWWKSSLCRPVWWHWKSSWLLILQSVSTAEKRTGFQVSTAPWLFPIGGVRQRSSVRADSLWVWPNYPLIPGHSTQSWGHHSQASAVSSCPDAALGSSASSLE